MNAVFEDMKLSKRELEKAVNIAADKAAELSAGVITDSLDDAGVISLTIIGLSKYLCNNQEGHALDRDWIVSGIAEALKVPEPQERIVQ